MQNRPVSSKDNIPLAVFAIVLAVFSLSLGDAIIKTISANFNIWQIFVYRSLVLAPLLVVLVKLRYPGVALIPRNAFWVTVRSLMLTLMWVIYYLSLPNIDLSVAAAAYYTSPLFITLFAALFIGDRVGRVGWVAVILGFAGVLVMLRPQAGLFNAYALLPIGAAILYALAMILTRTKCRDENPFVLSLALNIAFCGVGAAAALVIQVWQPSASTIDVYPFLLGSWAPMGITEWLAIAVLATAILFGSVGAAIAYQAGPPSLVATFDFSYLAFAALWGLVFFAEVPDALTALGMAMIVAAGLLAIRR